MVWKWGHKAEVVDCGRRPLEGFAQRKKGLDNQFLYLGDNVEVA